MGADSLIPPGELGFELMKLLLQVAWADGEVATAEREVLASRGRSLGLGADQQSRIDAALAGQAPLPVPNFSLLRQHRVAVLKQVRQLLQSDGQVSQDEEDLLAQISDLLK